MRSWYGGWLVVLCALAGLPAPGLAQEATLTGTVSDSTGGVLPGVTVTVLHEATGNTFFAVADERGAFRLPVRIGVYRLTAELQGFTTLNRRVELLVGQTAVVALEMSPATLEETVTVVGDVPLIDTASSTLGGNIDRRQMQELPINGRNWMDLAILAPGSRQNEQSNIPQSRQGYAQINIDGQQITHLIPGTDQNQPSYSLDAIAEFVLISNRFDATQGRSAGMLANAITKSGTNAVAGSLSGFFRSDRFNAADHIQGRVIPYSNQQVSGTLGGPIVRDRANFFVNYEVEREPRTVTFSSVFPSFNIDQAAKKRQTKGVVGRKPTRIPERPRRPQPVAFDTGWEAPSDRLERAGQPLGPILRLLPCRIGARPPPARSTDSCCSIFAMPCERWPAARWSRPSPCCRWRSASASTRRSFRCSSACSCAACRFRHPNRSSS